MSKTLFHLPAKEPFKTLAGYYPGTFSLEKGIQVSAKKSSSPGFKLERVDGKVKIEYNETADLMRAMGSLLSTPSISFDSGNPPITFRGVMLDVSRNGVLKVETVKKALVRLSLMGLNHFCLYTEDTYEIKGHPLIGYRRGKYSKKEIRELDAFAGKVGITMFPCIQTLGHLEQVIKNPQYMDLSDNPSVISVKSKEARELVRTFIKEASAPYKTDLIHLGLDETWGIGRGKTFEYMKPIDPRQMYLDHVNYLSSICKKEKLKPMMWGDVVVGYHDKPMDAKQKKALSGSLEMVFWDYYAEDSKKYEKRIAEYRKAGFEPMCAPGLWNWDHLWPSYQKTKQTLPLLMEVAKKKKIERMLVTMWGDDGQECPFNANWPGLSLYTEQAYEMDCDLENAKNRMKAVCSGDFDAFVGVGDIDLYPGKEKFCGTLSKTVLWEEPLSGALYLYPG